MVRIYSNIHLLHVQACPPCSLATKLQILEPIYQQQNKHDMKFSWSEWSFCWNINNHMPAVIATDYHIAFLAPNGKKILKWIISRYEIKNFRGLIQRKYFIRTRLLLLLILLLSYSSFYQVKKTKNKIDLKE